VKAGQESKYTSRMKYMWEDVMGSVFNCFPKDFIDFIFSDGFIPIYNFSEYLLLELIKYSYDVHDTKYPLRHFIDYDAKGDNSERMTYTRVLKYVQKYRDREYQIHINSASENIKDSLKELLPPDMSSIEGRLEGHKITAMNFFEQTTIRDIRIIKSIVEQRIFSTKKVSNNDFIDMFKEYDEWMQRLIDNSKKDSESLVFSAIAVFTIEWKFSIELLYSMAVYMEEKGIDEVDKYTLLILCGNPKFQSRIGTSVDTTSRMIKMRQLIAPYFIVKDELDAEHLYHREQYVESLALFVFIKENTCTEGGLYKDWFSENTGLEDWASFFEEYDVFEIWHKKEWTNKRIRLMRKLLSDVAYRKE